MKPVSKLSKQSQLQKHSKVSIMVQESPQKRSSFKNKPNLSNLWIIPQQAIFYYQNLNQQVLHAKINLNNQTQCKIYFQLTPNYQNKSFYVINPAKQVIAIQQAIQITITLNRNHKNFNIFSSDSFQLSWGSLPDMPGIPVGLTHAHTIPVKFIYNNVAQDRFTLGKPERKLHNNNSNILQQFQKQREQQQMHYNSYKRSNQNHIKKQEYQLQKKLSERMENTNKTNNSINSNKQTLLTQFNMIIVAVIFFLIGFLGT